MYLLQRQKVKLVQNGMQTRGACLEQCHGKSTHFSGQPLYPPSAPPFVFLMELEAASTTHYFPYRKNLGCYLSFNTHFVLGQHARAALLVYFLVVGSTLKFWIKRKRS